jgi:alpha-tubulin suppressor-like RCC1 family protein
MRTAASFLVATLAACSSTSAEQLCARFGLVPDYERDACRCPDDTIETSDGTGCVLPDGGVLPFPDAGARAAGIDGGFPLDTRDDAGDDAGLAFPDAGTICMEGDTRPCEGSDVGECSPGSQSCSGGEWGPCEDRTEPNVEFCDGLDNDCDTVVDGPAASASCGSPDRAVATGCSAGSCVIGSCTSGFLDCDTTFENGCEAELGTESSCGGCGDVCGWACGGSACDDALSVGAGDFHTCAVQRGGHVRCWGANVYGQIGKGIEDGTRNPEPTRVIDLSNATKIVLGQRHSCARRSDGSIRCWGYNGEGQIGDNSDVNQPAPATVGITNAIELWAGANHTCALRSDLRLYCWGQNGSGRLGDNSTIDRRAPVLISGVTSTIRKVAPGGSHTCAVTVGGSVWCWGDNASGQLANGTMTGRSAVPVQVSGISDAIDITSGRSHTCIVRTGGGVSCWGGNSSGQLGTGNTNTGVVPTAVAGLVSIVEIASSGVASRTCARDADGTVWCWGEGSFGSIGDGSTETRLSPVRVLEGAESLAVGWRHTCARMSDGGLRCWGNNQLGQLGDGSTEHRSSPTRVVPPID